MSEQPPEGFEALFQHTNRETEEAAQHPVEMRTEKETVNKEETTGTLPPKSISRLARLEQKKAQIEQQIKAIHARENEKVRRERTRRLIQIGALALKYLNCPQESEPQEFETFLKQFVEQPEVKRYLQR
jgi:hypothetical protein